MANDHTKKSVRSFQCRDYLYELFEEMSQDLDCSVDYLINEAMRQYAKSRNYGGKSIPGRASIPPTASAADAPMRESFIPENSQPAIAPASSAPAAPARAASIAPAAEGRPTPQQAPTAASALLEGADLTPPPTALPPLPAAPVPSARAAEPAPSFGLPPMAVVAPPASIPVAAPVPAPAPIPAPMPAAAALPPLGGGLPAPALPPLGGGLPPLGGLAAPALPPLPPAVPPGPPALPPAPPALPPMPPAAPVAAARPPLFIIFNGQKMPVTTTNNDEFIIGRSSKTADLAIKDGNISRRHAAIVYHGGAYYMKDLGSTNGVDFQGQKVGTKRIDEGDVFTVCEYEVRFTYH